LRIENHHNAIAMLCMFGVAMGPAIVVRNAINDTCHGDLTKKPQLRHARGERLGAS
jgi:hypothetical protein